MTKVYVSSVIPAPAAEVWKLLRNFNALPSWAPFVAESRIWDYHWPSLSMDPESILSRLQAFGIDTAPWLP